MAAHGYRPGGLLSEQGLLADDKKPIRPGIDPAAPLAPRKPHFEAKARRVLTIFCSGAVSHVDSFDYKPELAKHAGQELTGRGNVKDVFFRQPRKLMPSPFRFRQYGHSGKWCSDWMGPCREPVPEPYWSI